MRGGGGDTSACRLSKEEEKLTDFWGPGLGWIEGCCQELPCTRATPLPSPPPAAIPRPPPGRRSLVRRRHGAGAGGGAAAAARGPSSPSCLHVDRTAFPPPPTPACQAGFCPGEEWSSLWRTGCGNTPRGYCRGGALCCCCCQSSLLGGEGDRGESMDFSRWSASSPVVEEQLVESRGVFIVRQCAIGVQGLV